MAGNFQPERTNFTIHWLKSTFRSWVNNTRFLEILPEIMLLCSRILGFYAGRYPTHMGLPKLHGVTQNMLVRRSYALEVCGRFLIKKKDYHVADVK